ARFELLSLIDVCRRYERRGRDALRKLIDYALPPDHPDRVRIIGALDDFWPHTDDPQSTARAERPAWTTQATANALSVQLERDRAAADAPGGRREPGNGGPAGRRTRPGLRGRRNPTDQPPLRTP